jgi:hypothetical protein
MSLLNEVGIRIEDHWDKPSLKTDTPSIMAEETGYSYVELKSFDAVQEAFDFQ